MTISKTTSSAFNQAFSSGKNSALEMSVTFVFGYTMCSITQGLLAGANIGLSFIKEMIFGNPSHLIVMQPLCLKDRNISPIFPNTIYVPEGLKSPKNMGSFLAFLIPTAKLITFTTEKIARLITSESKAKDVSNFCRSIVTPFFSAYVCRQIGCDIDPYALLYEQMKITFFVKVVQVALLLNNKVSSQRIINPKESRADEHDRIYKIRQSTALPNLQPLHQLVRIPVIKL